MSRATIANRSLTRHIVLDIISSEKREWAVKEITARVDHRCGIIAVREALNELAERGTLVRRRNKSNLFTFSTPKS